MAHKKNTKPPQMSKQKKQHVKNKPKGVVKVQACALGKPQAKAAAAALRSQFQGDYLEALLNDTVSDLAAQHNIQLAGDKQGRRPLQAAARLQSPPQPQMLQPTKAQHTSDSGVPTARRSPASQLPRARTTQAPPPPPVDMAALLDSLQGFSAA